MCVVAVCNTFFFQSPEMHCPSFSVDTANDCNVIPSVSRHAAANNFIMNISMNVMCCLVCCNNLSSVAEDCPRGWTSKYVHNDATVRG